MDTTTKLLADFRTPDEDAADAAAALQGSVLVTLEALGQEILARIATGDRAKERASQMYISAGRQLIEAKGRVPDFKAFLRLHCNGLSRSRAYELIDIANGKPDEIRSKNRIRDRRRREKAGRVREPRTRGFSVKKPHPPKSQSELALAEFKYAADIRIPQMNDDAKREAIAYVIAKSGVKMS